MIESTLKNMSAVSEISETVTAPQLVGNGSDLYRLNVAAYDKMIEQGIFDEDDRIELWDGVLLHMSPKGIKHANAIRRIDQVIDSSLGNRVVFSAQHPIRLDDFSEPEPDVALLIPPIENYDLRHPTPNDIYLVLEISDTSLEKDRAKATSYGRNGICQYLILNLKNREVEDYREPMEVGYRSKTTYSENDTFRLVSFPEAEIRVIDLLPPKSDEIN